jgi:hypothetical protein
MVDFSIESYNPSDVSKNGAVISTKLFGELLKG